MSDLMFDFFNDDMNLDLVVKSGEIQKDDSLKSAVLISLFTDARCEKNELPAGENSLRGFWGDAIFGESTGSKLWLLNRPKFTNSTLIQAKQYAEDALKWLISDGLAQNIIVDAIYNNKKQMLLNISIFKINNEIESIIIDNLWSHL